MPKVSEYELERFDDDEFVDKQKRPIKKNKPIKEKKYSDKKDYRAD